jgi:hypothetical protein
MAIDPHVELYREVMGNVQEHLSDTPFPRLDHHDALRYPTVQRRLKFAIETALVRWIVKLTVINPDTPFRKRISKVTHCGKKEHDARFMGPHVLSLTRYLRHPHQISGFVETVKRGGIEVELIA